ncbi:hypothetical protein KIPB_016008, partial [Kipferlia bialata]|eukprot:g16008.t1
MPQEEDTSMWICKEPPVSVKTGEEEREAEGEEVEVDPATQ